MTETPEQPSRLDRIEDILYSVALQQKVNTLAIAELTKKSDSLTENVDSLTDIVMHAVGNAETVRESFQQEIRRIWDYLMHKGGNGSTPPNSQ